jgi:adhesin HecA-like repeat protein
MIYTLSGDNSDLSGGADFNKALVESGATNTTVSFSIATNSTETSYGFTPSGNPGADGATGNYTILARITTGNNNGRLSISLSRVNSSGTVQSTSSATSEQTTSAGTQTHTLTSVNLGTWAAGDRLRVNYIFRNANTMSAQTVAIGTGTSNDTVDVPWDLAGPPQDLTQASRLDNTQAFYAATLTQLPPAQSLTPGLFTNTQSFYAAEVIQPGPPQELVQTDVVYNTSALWDDFTWDSFVWDGQVFYPASISQPDTISPPLVVNNQTFYAATITTGAVVLQPSLLTNAQTFYDPTVTRGAVTLAPGLLTNNQAFYAATVTRGAVTLLPSRLDNAQSFYGATITRGAVTLQPGRLDNTQVFYGPVVAVGGAALLPPLVTNDQIFYGPVVQPGAFTLVQSERLDNVTTFYSPLVYLDGDLAETPAPMAGFMANMGKMMVRP